MGSFQRLRASIMFATCHKHKSVWQSLLFTVEITPRRFRNGNSGSENDDDKFEWNFMQNVMRFTAENEDELM